MGFEAPFCELGFGVWGFRVRVWALGASAVRLGPRGIHIRSDVTSDMQGFLRSRDDSQHGQRWLVVCSNLW